MRNILVESTAAIVRLWTRLYTAGLPPDVRATRRLEIESDLWEAAHDPAEHDRPGRVALGTLRRLAAGLRHDVAWRHDQETCMRRNQLATAALGVTFGVVALWVVVVSQMATIPALPPPRPLIRAQVFAPPPPPAPPLSPRGVSAPAVQFTYGRASYAPLGPVPVPRRIKEVAPIHPPIAVMSGVSGTVVLDATIDETGHVSEARIRSSVPLLDQSAVDAVRQWIFEAPIDHGRPTAAAIQVTVIYPAAK